MKPTTGQRRFPRHRRVVAALCGAVFGVTAGSAEEPFVTTMAGATSTSADYTLLDTLGEPVVGSATSADYAVAGGFAPTLNLAPIPAQDRLLSAATGGKFRISSLLTNDFDPDLESVSILSIAPVSGEGGSVTTGEGWVFYTPPLAWSGSDLLTYTVADTAGNHVAGSIVVQSVASGPAAPRTIVRIRSTPEGHRAVRFIGIAGRSYSIQTKNDLSDPDWTEVAVVVAAPNGLFDFTDVETPLPAQRFYRATSR